MTAAAALLAAMPDPAAVDEHWRRICREMVARTAAAEYERGQVVGYLLAVADFKAWQHGAVKDAGLERRQWHLCCPRCAATRHRDGCRDCEDRTRATFGRPGRRLPRTGEGRVIAADQAHADADVPWPEETAALPGRRERRGPEHSDTADNELLAGIHDGAWLDEQEFAALRYAIDGLIPEGLTILVGPPKAGKSWLILDLLLAASCGGTALGHIKAAPPRRVLYLALEDGDRRMQDRCRKLLAGSAIPALFSYKTRILPGTVLATVTAWMRRRPDTALVVIDTLGKVMPPALIGESSYQRDYRVGSALKELADTHPGLAVVILHHDRKATADDFVDSVSATHGLAGAADTIVVLARKRQAVEGSLKITGRDVPENEYALTLTDGVAWHLAAPDLAAAAAVARQREETTALGDRSLEVLALVNKHPEGLRAAEAVKVFGNDAYQYLKRLADAGRIDKVTRGKYVPLVPPSGQSGVSGQENGSRPHESDTPHTSDRGTGAAPRATGEDQ